MHIRVVISVSAVLLLSCSGNTSQKKSSKPESSKENLTPYVEQAVKDFKVAKEVTIPDNFRKCINGNECAEGFVDHCNTNSCSPIGINKKYAKSYLKVVRAACEELRIKRQVLPNCEVVSGKLECINGQCEFVKANPQ